MSSNRQKALELAVTLYTSPVDPFPGSPLEHKWNKRTLEELYLFADEIYAYFEKHELTVHNDFNPVNQHGQPVVRPVPMPTIPTTNFHDVLKAPYGPPISHFGPSPMGR